MCNFYIKVSFLTYNNYFYLCDIHYVTTAHLLFTNNTAIIIIILYVCVYIYIYWDPPDHMAVCRAEQFHTSASWDRKLCWHLHGKERALRLEQLLDPKLAAGL